MFVRIFLGIFFAKPKINQINLTSLLIQFLSIEHEIAGLHITIKIANLMKFSDAFEGIEHDDKNYIFLYFVLEFYVHKILV